MEDTITQRIMLLMKQKKISVSSLAKELDVPQTTLNGQIKDEKSLKANTILALIEKYNDISLDWLLTGKGEMLKNNQQVGNIENSTAVGVNVFGSNNSFKIPEEDITKSIRQYQDTIKKQQEQIDKLLVIIQNLSSNGK
jgi:Icc-related predicted phosphoesterase